MIVAFLMLFQLIFSSSIVSGKCQKQKKSSLTYSSIPLVEDKVYFDPILIPRSECKKKHENQSTEFFDYKKMEKKKLKKIKISKVDENPSISSAKKLKNIKDATNISEDENLSVELEKFDYNKKKYSTGGKLKTLNMKESNSDPLIPQRSPNYEIIPQIYGKKTRPFLIQQKIRISKSPQTNKVFEYNKHLDPNDLAKKKTPNNAEKVQKSNKLSMEENPNEFSEPNESSKSEHSINELNIENNFQILKTGSRHDQVKSNSIDQNYPVMNDNNSIKAQIKPVNDSKPQVDTKKTIEPIEKQPMAKKKINQKPNTLSNCKSRSFKFVYIHLKDEKEQGILADDVIDFPEPLELKDVLRANKKKSLSTNGFAPFKSNFNMHSIMITLFFVILF